MSNWNKTEIAGHNIYWIVFEEPAAELFTELDDTSIDHVQGLLNQGCFEGELIMTADDVDYRGAWEKDPLGRASGDLVIQIENLLQYIEGKEVTFEQSVIPAKRLLNKLSQYSNV